MLPFTRLDEVKSRLASSLPITPLIQDINSNLPFKWENLQVIVVFNRRDPLIDNYAPGGSCGDA